MQTPLRLFRCLMRGLSVEAASAETNGTPAVVSRNWPLDVHGEELRTAKARLLGLSTSDRKLNLVARLIRGLSVNEAFRQLRGSKKKHAEDVARTVHSAIVNARSFNLNENRLVVHEAYVGKGKYLKKIRPWHGKGRFGIEHKKYAHLTIVLRELDNEAWERKVLPQYIHRRFRSPQHAKKRVKEFKLDGWTTQSQLDLSFRITREKVQGLKEALQ